MQNQSPLVSIVTPSFNQAAYLESCIQSVLEQDYRHLEYIVVDGASTDGSLDLLERYADRLAWWVSEPDAGQTAAINKGLSQAKGEIVAWLNSDDVLYPGAVAQAVEVLRAQPEIGLVYGAADYIDVAGRRLGRFPSASTGSPRLRRGFVHIPPQAAFFRARLWKMVGPLDESFHFAMDYDLWVRIAAVSPIAYHPRRWAGVRLHEEGKTLTAPYQAWPEMIRVHRRDGGGWLSPITVKYLVRRLVDPLWSRRLRPG